MSQQKLRTVATFCPVMLFPEYSINIVSEGDGSFYGQLFSAYFTSYCAAMEKNRLHSKLRAANQQ